jgi:hypothetical protein
MAFTGIAVIQQISDRLLRITGITLVASAAGTIGLAGTSGAPDITLPASFQTARYPYGAVAVPYQASIRVTWEPASAGAVETNLPPSIVKTGTTPADFLITITNTNVGATTQDLELYIEFTPGRAGQPDAMLGAA